MPEDNPEKKRLVVDISGPPAEVDRINDRITEVIGDVASEEVSIEVLAQPINKEVPAELSVRSEPSWVGQNKATYTRGLSRKYRADMMLPVAPELYTWVEHTETGQIAVISKHNMADFSASKQQIDDPAAPMQTRYQNFFSRLVSYQSYRADEGDDYVLLAEGKRPGEPFVRPLGIKVNGSLELLRRLKSADIGEHKWSDEKQIKGIGPVMIDAFEEYCEELFPGVDVSLASQELDLDFMNRLLDRSERRTRVWAWAVRQEVGLKFKAAGTVASNSPPTGNSNPYLDNLSALGLIDRRPEEPRQPARYYPYEKMRDSRWADLEKLMIERGGIPEPA